MRKGFVAEVNPGKSISRLSREIISIPPTPSSISRAMSDQLMIYLHSSNKRLQKNFVFYMKKKKRSLFLIRLHFHQWILYF